MELREELSAIPQGYELLSYHYGQLLIYYVLYREHRIVAVIGARVAAYL